ncbi:MAG: adenylate/guanylate cyclase domain-containing protein [Sulfuritalea sp.]|nr:adenylate/guanylate cyclase domain-containing protein [Sulfuritalea sp.]
MSAKPSAPIGTPQDNTDVLRERLNTITAAYSRFVPREFLNLLGIEDIRKVEVGQQVERKMTILFADIRNFTALSESMSPQENFNFLNSYLIQMEPVITAHGGFIDKYVGDAIMALFPESPDAALRCALAMLERLEHYNNGRQRAGYRPIKIGIGINTGIVILGTIGGAARMDGTVIGDAVNLASRLERLTKEYRVSILISEYTLYCLDQPDLWSIRFLDRTHVRGKQGTQSVYEVFDGDPPPLRDAKKNTVKNFERALAYYHIDDILTARERLNAHVANVPEDDAAYVYLERCEIPAEGPGSSRAELPAIWREEYCMDLAVLDIGHKNLLAEMNALARAINVSALNLTPPLLAQIQFSATRDFLIEEQMMKQESYPFIDLHIRQHQRFFEYFHELRHEIDLGEEDRVYLGFRVKRFLTGWLVNHVLSADRHYGHYRRSMNQQPANL